LKVLTFLLSSFKTLKSDPIKSWTVYNLCKAVKLKDQVTYMNGFGADTVCTAMGLG